jgi:hypothetical protein
MMHVRIIEIRTAETIIVKAVVVVKAAVTVRHVMP